MEKKLKELHPNPNNIIIKAISSATYSQLTDIACNIIKENDPSQCHVYFLAGLCDITYRDYDPKFNYQKYEEVIFNESPWVAKSRVLGEVEAASEKILTTGAKPCFATIVPSSLTIWNELRLQQYKTSFLLHHNHYESMQYNLIKSIHSINNSIIEINETINMRTPLIASTIMTNKSKSKLPRIHYSRLTDGVHPCEKTRDKWAEKLVHTILENRGIKIQVIPPHLDFIPSTPFQPISSSDSETDSNSPKKPNIS